MPAPHRASAPPPASWSMSPTSAPRPATSSPLTPAASSSSCNRTSRPPRPMPSRPGGATSVWPGVRSSNSFFPSERKVDTMRTRAFTALLGAVALVLAGCGDDKKKSNTESQGETKTSTTSDGSLQKLGAGEGAVNVIAWAGYVENGSNDPKVDWITGFEKESGCKVNAKVAGTSDEMV